MPAQIDRMFPAIQNLLKLMVHIQIRYLLPSSLRVMSQERRMTEHNPPLCVRHPQPVIQEAKLPLSFHSEPPAMGRSVQSDNLSIADPDRICPALVLIPYSFCCRAVPEILLESRVIFRPVCHPRQRILRVVVVARSRQNRQSLRQPVDTAFQPPELFRLDTIPDHRVEAICELIEGNLREKYSNTELAERAGLSRNSFIRLFREKTGETPQQFRLRKSVEYAAGELHYSTHSIDEIAEAAGFSDRFHFTKVFGRFMQMPPAAYRRITRGESGHTGR